MIAAIFVGCTSRQTEAEYTTNVQRALTTRNKVSDALDKGDLRTSDQLREASEEVASARSGLDSSPPPATFTAAHNKFVETLDGFETLIRRQLRCAELDRYAAQDARACRLSIKQSVFDELRNDFREADAIYRNAGLTLEGLRDEEPDSVDEGGDVLGE